MYTCNHTYIYSNVIALIQLIYEADQSRLPPAVAELRLLRAAAAAADQAQ